MSDVDEGIFTNTEEVIEGVKKSAEAVGLDSSKVIDESINQEFFAKEKCKMCWGRGVLSFIPSPSKEKKKKSRRGRKKSNKESSQTSWSTRRPLSEPAKQINVYCRCVRVLNQEEK